MSNLKSLTFTVLPQPFVHNPKFARRQRLIERLEEQRRLAQDPTFIPVAKRWKKTADGSKALVDHPFAPSSRRRASPRLPLTSNRNPSLPRERLARTLNVVVEHNINSGFLASSQSAARNHASQDAQFSSSLEA